MFSFQGRQGDTNSRDYYLRFNDDSTSNSCNYIHWDSGLSDGEGGSTQGSGNHQNGADNIKIGVGGGEGRYVVATGFILNYYDGTNKSDKLITLLFGKSAPILGSSDFKLSLYRRNFINWIDC